MNIWTQRSVDFASQRNYLDELFRVYPISPNERREIDDNTISRIEGAFNNQNNEDLIRELLNLELFPIKDSYVAYLRRDRTAIERNPRTINRIAGNLYNLGFNEVINRATEPKETNRQIGPMFKNWLNTNPFGTPIYNNHQDFLDSEEDCILNMSDEEMKRFANQYLGYTREKGIDFLGKFNNKYIIGETKFLTDFGGHQDAQFDDAVSTAQSDFSGKAVENEVIPIAIMDGVLYIQGNNKMYRYINENNDMIIISALLLGEFLYSC